MWALLLSCASFHSNPMIALPGFSTENVCQQAGKTAITNFVRLNTDTNNLKSYDNCKFICVNQRPMSLSQ